MASRLETQAEPIPGYKLLERLGSGGFGEVWKAEAPGGLLKAIKFVHGNMDSSGSEMVRAEQELKALNRVKTVRHPYILSLERIDVVNGQLVIVMELADKSLGDRFDECRDQGLPGIPRDELLRCMEEAAEALDLMATQFNLQHLDVKPQNLFLVYNHVKVADFGLVKDLQGMQGDITSCVTPLYGAPETFDGMVSPFCDQYSLAIVYQELLTGQRPFNGGNAHQLLLQHQGGEPDLSSLPPADRVPLAKALAKDPEKRHPSCKALVEALRQAPLGETPRPVNGLSSTVFAPPAGQPPRTAPANGQAAPATPGLRPMATPGPRESHTQVHVNAKRPLTSSEPPRPKRDEQTGPGLLFPALVIGIGKVGLKVLRQLRRSLNDRYGSPAQVPHLRLLYLDTDAEAAEIATHGDPAGCLREREVLMARLNRPVHYLKAVRGRPAPESWLPPKLIYRIPRDQANAAGVRALGRLALIDNFPAVTRRLHAEVDALTDPATRTAADRATQLGQRTNRPRIYLAAGLGGGTGSGMFLDLAYLVRHILRQRGFDNPDVVGLFLVPPAGRGADDLALGNAYAALTELNHYASPQVTYTGHFDDSAWPISDPEAPFGRCILLPEQGRGSGANQDMAARAGDFLCRDLITPLGRMADECREHLQPQSGAQGLKCQTFGLHWISWPRKTLGLQIGRKLGCRLVDSWLSRDRNHLRVAVQEWVGEQWAQQKLSFEGIQGELMAVVHEALGMTPEAAFEVATASMIQPAEVMKTLQRMEQLVGKPDAEPLQPKTTVVGDALHRALAKACKAAAEKVGQLTLGLIDQPRFRMAGAEEAVIQLTSALETVLQSHEARYRGLAIQTAEVHARIHSLAYSLQKGSSWFGKKGKTAAELAELLGVYPQLRLQYLLLHMTLAIYRHMKDNLAVRQREVAFCRSRLGEFQRQLGLATGAEKQKLEAPAAGQYLLPPGCWTLAEAQQKIAAEVSPAELVELDIGVQEEVNGWLKSLVHVCLSSSNLFDNLQTAICKQAEAFAANLLGGADLVEIYRKQRGGVEQVISDMAAAFDAALPELAPPVPSTAELRILAAPAGEVGERFRFMAKEALPEVDWTGAASTDELVFYREQPLPDLAELPQLGAAGRSAYKRLCQIDHFTPHSRCDIYDWQPLDPHG